MLSDVPTVTISPAANGVAGSKLPPLPSESACTVPGCEPLRDPVTVIVPSWLAGTPRKVICVAGEANCPPGIGNTYTGGGPGGGFGAGWRLVLAPAPLAAIRHRRTPSPTAVAL